MNKDYEPFINSDRFTIQEIRIFERIFKSIDSESKGYLSKDDLSRYQNTSSLPLDSFLLQNTITFYQFLSILSLTGIKLTLTSQKNEEQILQQQQTTIPTVSTPIVVQPPSITPTTTTTPKQQQRENILKETQSSPQLTNTLQEPILNQPELIVLNTQNVNNNNNQTNSNSNSNNNSNNNNQVDKVIVKEEPVTQIEKQIEKIETNDVVPPLNDIKPTTTTSTTSTTSTSPTSSPTKSTTDTNQVNDNNNINLTKSISIENIIETVVPSSPPKQQSTIRISSPIYINDGQNVFKSFTMKDQSPARTSKILGNHRESSRK